MIARIWHEEIFSEKGNEFLEYIKQTCLTGIKETNGNLIVEILRRDDEKLTHFFIISLGNFIRSIKRFTDRDITKAHLYPKDRLFLIR